MYRIQTWFAHQWQRTRFSASKTLEQQQRKIITEIFDRLSDTNQREFVEHLLESLSVQETGGGGTNGHLEFIASTLDQLTTEERQFLVDEALSKLSGKRNWDRELEEKQRSLYHNYQNYKTIQRTLGTLPNSVKESFAILARRAQTRGDKAANTINQFREEIALWFDRSMSRASGVYKRNTKGVAILIGLSLVIATNVDAGFIVDRLSNNENLRTVVANRASTLTPDKNLDQVRTETNEALEDLALPIGWSPENVTDQLNCKLPKNSNDLPKDWSDFYRVCLEDKVNSHQITNQANLSSPQPLRFFLSALGNLLQNSVALLIHYPLALLRILLGWLIAGIAISMGAPFWFDLLSKIVNVRNSGDKPSSENQSAK